MVSNTATAERRIVRLADIEAVKWVTGCFRDRSIETRRLTADEIAEIADIEMHQPYPAEPGTWANVSFHDKYITVMAIVATDATERGSRLVASGQTCTENQVDGLAIGSYAEQQLRLASEIGECSEGCGPDQIMLVTRVIEVSNGFVPIQARQVCRHTLRPCRSCNNQTAKRIELLERLVLHCRKLFCNPLETSQQAESEAIAKIVAELDSF